MITLAAAKEQLNIVSTNTTHDAELQAFVDATQAVVERYTRETMTRRSFTEKRVVHNVYRLQLDRRPVPTLTSITRLDASTTWTLADIDVDSDSGVLRVLEGSALTGLLSIVYEAGYATIPDNYALAARIIVQHLWQTQRSGSAPRVGGDVLAVDGGFGFAIPNAAAELLGVSGPLVA